MTSAVGGRCCRPDGLSVERHHRGCRMKGGRCCKPGGHRVLRGRLSCSEACVLVHRCLRRCVGSSRGPCLHGHRSSHEVRCGQRLDERCGRRMKGGLSEVPKLHRGCRMKGGRCEVRHRRCALDALRRMHPFRVADEPKLRRPGVMGDRCCRRDAKGGRRMICCRRHP